MLLELVWLQIPTMKVLFYHVAKTGGMSIRRILLGPHGIKNFDCFHNGMIIEFRDGIMCSRRHFQDVNLPAYDYAFYFVRDPLHRLLSCYQYFTRGGLSQFHPGRFPADQHLQQYLLERFPSFSLCCEALDEISIRIPHIRQVSYWLNRLPDPLANEVFVGRTEGFNADVSTALSSLRLDTELSLYPHLNRSSSVGTDTSLDRSTCERVRDFYAEDYRKFSYG